MLLNLHVRNIALIGEIDLDLGDGLNILSGETGAGKSLLLGSLNIALGGRAAQDMIRHGEKEALVELVFSVDDPKVLKILEEMEIGTEERTLIISRRISAGRTVSRMNGVTVTAADVRRVTAALLDIHGQHENQSLLLPEKQLSIIDSFGGETLSRLLDETKKQFRSYSALRKELASYDMDEAARRREESLLQYEQNEILQAGLRDGEEEELAALYKKMLNARKIIDSLSNVKALIGDEGAAGFLGKAIREIASALSYDEDLNGINDSLSEIEALLYDAERDASACLEDLDFSDRDFADTESRLDLIRSLTAKYGGSCEAVREYAEKASKRLDFLNHYVEEKAGLEAKLQSAESELKKACEELSKARKQTAASFVHKVTEELKDLNFKKVEFNVRFGSREEYSAEGCDTVTFEISVNPGEPLRPVSKVASGGELSRIMLAIRTLLADRDSTGTLVFDEIDTGISGVTAQKVAEKMALISAGHQLICVTHLPQIAAMADHNYLIEKESGSHTTETLVRKLNEPETVLELARMLGGSRITEAVKSNASEMRMQASEFKSKALNS